MRIMIAAALLAASDAAVPAAAAESPVLLPPLAADEVLLEVDGLAIVRSPATSALVTAAARGRGATADDARRALDADIQRITALARAAGVTAADIQVRPATSTSIRTEALRQFDVREPPPPEGEEAAPAPEYYAESTVTIRLRNAARAAELHRALNSDPMDLGPYQPGPVYELDDDSAARREARRRAVAAARADAEAYAAAVDMRIVRMLRITERAGPDFLAMLATEREAAQGLEFRGAREDAQVDTRAVVGIDFVLAPR